MDSKTMNVMIIIVLTLVFILVPMIMKKVVWKKLLVQLSNEQYDEFYKTLDTGACKFSYQAFNREYMRLSGYLAQRNDAKIEEQFELLKNMRISNKQKASVATRGFYYYLEKGKIKKAEGMLSYGKSYIDEKTFKNMQIQFSILMKKEAKYIDDCKEILNGMWDGKSELDNNKKFPVGTIQYLIGLQYSYLKDVAHGVLLWLTGEEVAAPRAPDRANQPGPGELSYNLLQIFIGNLLPLGHIPQRNCRAMAVKGHIQHEAERITAFRGNFHAHPYLF